MPQLRVISAAFACRYAGYPLLLQAIVLPGEEGQSSGAAAQQAHPAQQAQQQHFLSAEAAPQLQAATELCWLTCAASRLNGDELTRAGGLGLLGRLLSRCIAGARGGGCILLHQPMDLGSIS